MALVITELDPGGAELCLTELACHLAARGHQVKVWTIGRAPQSPRDRLAERLKAAGIDVQFGNARGSYDAWRVMRWLRKQLLSFQPDLVQSMLWHANLLSAWALVRSKTPLVGGMRVSEPRSGRWWLERLAARRMQRAVCVSHDVLEHAATRQGIDRSKLCVIPNGVPDQLLDQSLTAGDWLTIDSNIRTNVLLFAGRLEPQKGVVPLVKHAARWLRQYPDWSLVLLGQGTLKATIEQQIQAAGMQSQIHLVGWHPSAPMWMKASQVVVLPAVYEGMPNVLLEAMATSKPFVAFAVDGVSQLLTPGDDYPADLAAAQLAAPGDWESLERNLTALLRDDRLRNLCGSTNREHVARHFRLTTHLDDYVKLYEQLVKRSEPTALAEGSPSF